MGEANNQDEMDPQISWAWSEQDDSLGQESREALYEKGAPAVPTQNVEASQTSQVDNRDTLYQNAGDVFNAPVNKQTVVQDNSVTYDVDREDTDFIERLSIAFIEILGERNTRMGAIISGLMGIGSVLASVYRTPAFLAPYSQQLVYLSIALGLVAATLWAAVTFRYESRCTKCNTFYAMKEVGEPKAREVAVKDGVRRTTIRSYRCAKCGNEITKKTNRLIESEAST